MNHAIPDIGLILFERTNHPALYLELSKNPQCCTQQASILSILDWDLTGTAFTND